MGVKISVIMPSLNVSEYIDECIQSVLNQKFADIEILCIDAGSTDGTYEKLEDYKMCDNRIQLLQSDKKSYGYQVNMGIKKATGEYIAIVETDDYIDETMFSELYAWEEKNHLDYIKAGAISVKSYGKINILNKMKFGDEESSINNSVISSKEQPQIIGMDYYIWRGLYNREFLLNNQIFCNETAGAAYQDIGFTHLVTVYATKCMFIDKPLYYYRLFRQGNSTTSLKGMQFTYQEYVRLLDDLNICSKISRVQEKYFWARYSRAILCEINYILKNNEFDYKSIKLDIYYRWAKQILTNHVINIDEVEELLDKESRNKIRLLCDNFGEYASGLRDKELQSQRSLNKMLEYINGDNVIVFGCGNLGNEIIEKLLERNIVIEAICDNNSILWGKKIGLWKIESPQVVMKKSAEKKFIIANKKYSQDIKKQLENNCVQHMYIYSG